MGLTIEVMYSCHGCGLRDAAVTVPERGDEDVVKWLDRVRAFIGADHASRSPHCRSGACDLKIPVPAGTEKVGKVVRQ
jgi:hypothetical protein